MNNPTPFDKVTFALDEIPEWAESKSNKRFLFAFRRLVSNNPKNVPKGTPVNQRQVALEAGATAAAIKTDKHAKLIDLINAFKESQEGQKKAVPKKKDQLAAKEAKIKRLNDELSKVTAERDEAQSKITSLSLDLLSLRAKVAKLTEALDKTGGDQKKAPSTNRLSFPSR